MSVPKDRMPSTLEIRTGRIIMTMVDGSEYTDRTPIPCDEKVSMWFDPDGHPYGLMIDFEPYRIRRSPRLYVPPSCWRVEFCRRVKPAAES